MFKFLLDVFCYEPIIGLCGINGSKKYKLYKNKHSKLFRKCAYECSFNSQKFIDPIAYRL